MELVDPVGLVHTEEREKKKKSVTRKILDQKETNTPETSYQNLCLLHWLSFITLATGGPVLPKHFTCKQLI